MLHSHTFIFFQGCFVIFDTSQVVITVIFLSICQVFLWGGGSMQDSWLIEGQVTLSKLTVTDERNVRQFPLAEVFILLFFICVWDTCKIKSAFILSPGDRVWEGVRLITNCLQKLRKLAFFLVNIWFFFLFWRFGDKGCGSAAIWKLSPGAKICAIFILQGSLIPYIY